MKKLLILVGLVVGSAVADDVQERDVTTVGIFIDQPDQQPNERAIAYDCLTAINDHCDHIFLNPTLFKTIVPMVYPDLFLEQYSVYDTHKGLIYLHATCDTEPAPGVKTEDFTRLHDVTDATLNTLSGETFWVPELFKLFDAEQWQTYHKETNREVLCYVNGHGHARSGDILNDYCCSTNSLVAAALLNSLQKRLACTVCAVKSGYWTAQRLLEVMQAVHKVKTLAMALVTPIHTEVSVPVTLRYVHEKNSFFAACRQAAGIIHQGVTPALVSCLRDTDTAYLLQEQQQSPMVVLPGQQKANIVDQVQA